MTSTNASGRRNVGRGIEADMNRQLHQRYCDMSLRRNLHALILLACAAFGQSFGLDQL